MRPIQVIALRGVASGSGAYVTAVTLSPSGIDGGWASATLRQKIPTSALLAGSKMRITLTSPSGDAATISACYIQTKAATGDPYDFSATPVQVMFSGSATVSIPGLTSVVSDDIALAVSGSVELIFSAQFASSPASSIGSTSGGSATGFANYYKNGASDAATVDATGYTTYLANNCLLISKIEIYQP
jgi:hypothetical protein